MSGDFAGRLRERVILLRRSADLDGLGAPSDDWTAHDMPWAAIEPEGHGAIFEGGSAAAMPVWRVMMRPCEVAVGDRVAWAWATIDVREVRSDPRLPDRIVAIGEERR
jgi:head-tail adaptor